MDAVKEFGKIAEKLIAENPGRAASLMDAAFQAYGWASRLFGRGVAARRYMLWACNRATGRSLNRTKNSAVVSIFTPCEVLHAMDVLPLFPEGLSCYMAAVGCEKTLFERAENDGVPETLCSYHKMLIGMAELQLLPRPRFILNTTLACDANQLTFRRLSEYYDAPHLVLDVPYYSSERNVRYLEEQLRDMVGFVEKHTGKKLDEDRLSEIVGRSRRSLENYRAALELKRERFESSKITAHMIDAFGLHVLRGTKETERYTERLITDLKHLPKGRRKPRLLWVHTLPYWQESLCRLFDYGEQAEIVTCDMDLDAPEELTWSNPYRAMAEYLIGNAFNGPAERRIGRVLTYAEKMNVDGIVYFCHWGCKQTLGASAAAKREFERAGFPVLVIDGDGCDRRNLQEGQMVTRVEAFLEQLEGRRC